MRTNEVYNQKIEAELELAIAKLVEFKAQAKRIAADSDIERTRQVDRLEQKVEAAKAKLKALGESDNEPWAQSFYSILNQADPNMSDVIRQPSNTWIPTLAEMICLASLIGGLVGTVWRVFCLP